MIKALVNLLSLLLAATGTNIDKSKLQNETLKLTATSITSDYILLQQQQTVSDNFKNETLEISKSVLKSFSHEVKLCRKTYSSLSPVLFRMSLYCFLINSKNEISGNFHCNFTKELTEELHDNLHKIPFFQEVSILNKKYYSCGKANLTESSEAPQETTSGNFAAIEDNLKLKLGDEWIKVEPKVPYMSHIYLGTSKFPILTEESRILDIGSPYVSPSPTQTAFSQKMLYNKKDVDFQSEATAFSNIYRLLKPSRWENNRFRVSRSLQKPKYNFTDVEARRKLNKKLKIRNIYTVKYEKESDPTYDWLNFDTEVFGNDTMKVFKNKKSPNFFQKGVEYVKSVFAFVF